MTDLEPLIREQLGYLVPRPVVIEDWQDVLSRAAVVQRPQRLEGRAGALGWRPRTRAVVIVAFVVAVVVVPVGVAFHRQLLDLIQGKPAPISVVTGFRLWNTIQTSERERATGMKLFANHFSQLDVSKAQGVVELQTSDRTVSLWEAPQKAGGECWLFVFGTPETSGSRATKGAGTCDSQPLSNEAIISAQWIEAAALPNVMIVHARVHDAAIVELRFADGKTDPMAVVAGHAVAAIAADSSPTAVIAKSANGTVIQTSPLHLPPLQYRSVCAGVCAGGTGGSTTYSFGETTLAPGGKGA